MKTKLFFFFMLVFCSLGSLTNAQMLSQIVFESDTGSTTNLWSVLAMPGAVPIELTPLINAQAIQSGNTFGPVNVSHNGKWYTFQSERFDADCAGWHCLTVADSNFTNIVSIRDGNNSVIHNESLAMITDNGNSIVYSSDAGTHTRDIFIIHRAGNAWTAPKMLTGSSTYAYNINPRFSFDGSKVIFQGQSTSYPGESIMIIDTNGTNLTEKINRNATVGGIVGCSEVNMPSFAPDGSIFFEGLWGGERIWHFPNGVIEPVLPDPSDGNDNSPVGLPDGRVASLQLPNATHDLKVENADGTDKFFLTGSGTGFNHDINDVGLGAGLVNTFLTGIASSATASPNIFNIFPNPSAGIFTLSVLSPGTKSKVIIYNALGEIIFESQIVSPKTVIALQKKPKGIYLLRLLRDNNKNSALKLILSE